MRVELADNLTVQIFHDEGGWLYEIDLERCRTSAETLDWLYQLLYKKWCTPQVMFDVMWAIETACHKYHHQSVQGMLCGLGIDHRIKWPLGGSHISGT